MMSNTQLLAVAESQLGNGGAKYRKYVGAGGNYCNMFVYWLFNANGCASLLPFPKANYGRTYCPSSIKWCRKNLAEIPPYLALPCDVIYMDWEPNGVPNHIGIVKHKISTSQIATIEGNTSGKKNGKTVSGIVASKTRNTKYTNVFRPHFTATFKDKALVVDGDFGFQSIGGLQKALKILGYYKGAIDTILGINTVKSLQKWAGTTADGCWREGTSKAIQKKLGGLTVDGAFGEKSVVQIQKWINANVYQEKQITLKPTTPTTPTTTPTTDNKATETLGKCIDVSYWQAKISEANWKKILKTCQYAICRASYTSLGKFSLNSDSTFDANVKNARAAGIKRIGAYHFSQALSVAEAEKEAKYLCDILDKYDIDFWVACDYETNSKGRLNGKTVSTKASDIANAFCAVVEKRGYKACIYANYTMLTKYLKAPKYPIWLAQYNKTKSYDKNVVMWQYTSSGEVDGITAKNTNNKSANVDLSYVYELPIYAEPPKVDEKKDEDILKKPNGKYSGIIPNTTLKKGSKGESVKYLQKFLNWYGNFKLIVDGELGELTESALKIFQKTEGISADGVYGTNSYNKLITYVVSANALKLIAKMKEIAWAYGTAKEKYAYNTGSPKEACKKAMAKYGYKKKAQWSDCGDFVNTVVREAGIDKNFISLHAVKTAFPKKEDKFNIVFSGEAIPSGLLQPGDIIRYKKTNNSQHAMFYFGDNKVCDAGHFNRFGNIRKDEKRYAGKKVKKSTIQVLRAK